MPSLPGRGAHEASKRNGLQFRSKVLAGDSHFSVLGAGMKFSQGADNTDQGDHSRLQETSPTDQVHESWGHPDCRLTHLSSLPVPVSYTLQA